MKYTINQNEFNALALNIIRKFNRTFFELPELDKAKKFVLAEITERGKYNFSQSYKYILMQKILKMVLETRV